MTDGIDDAKRALRADLRERRQQRSEAMRAADAAGVKAQLDALIARTGARDLLLPVGADRAGHARVRGRRGRARHPGAAAHHRADGLWTGWSPSPAPTSPRACSACPNRSARC
jgi:hypothetical protein